MPTAERRKQPRPVSTEDDLARFHASVAGGNHFPTTTRRPRTRANTGSDLAHARETTREKRRTERPRGAQSAETKGVALARRICEVPPRLAYRADVKKPETSSGFWNWWWNTEPNPRPLSEPDSNALALRAWIRRFGHRHCSEPKSNSSQSLPDQRKPSSSGMADAPFGRIEKCRLFPVVLSDQVAWQVPHWQ